MGTVNHLDFLIKNAKNRIEKAGAGTGSTSSIVPSQALVIAGLLGGVLDVVSITIDNTQAIQILLQGSLKKKTQMDEIMDDMMGKIGALPFEDVVKAFLERLS